VFSTKRVVPTLDACAPGHISQYFPIPIATGEIEPHIRRDVKTIGDRKENYPGCHTAAENNPLPTAARRPRQNCKAKQQRKCRREDLSLEKNGKGSYGNSGCYPGALSFARSKSNKYQRRSGDRNSIEAGRRNVLEPKITIIRMSDVQQTCVR
jgi:hypothetical protein